METKPVLIIAEEEDRLFYAGFQLEDEELFFQSPEELFEQIDQLEADLILLDGGTPPEVSLALLPKIKAKFPQVPIIFLTSKSSEDIAVRAYKLGIRDYFRKTTPITSLHRSIKLLLELKRNSREKRGFQCYENAPEEICFNGKDQAKIISAATLNAIRYIDNNLLNKITLADLCQEAKVSKYHFSRNFKTETGLSPIQYVKFKKIQAAKTLLANPGTNVTTVAFRLGFNDVSSFIRTFKKFEGTTPYAFRTSNKRFKN